MKKTFATGLAILAFFAFSFAHSGKHEGSAKVTKHFNDTLFVLSEKGQMTMELLLDEKEYRIGKDVFGFVIHDSHDEDVEDAKPVVTVTGLSEPLKVTEKGGGLYLIPKTGLPQDGAWKLGIAVKKRKIEDQAVFDFPAVLKSRMPAGKYDAGSLKEKM